MTASWTLAKTFLNITFLSKLGVTKWAKLCAAVFAFLGVYKYLTEEKFKRVATISSTISPKYESYLTWLTNSHLRFILLVLRMINDKAS